MNTLRDIDEDRLIDRLTALTPVAPGVAGPGDDCAVLDCGGTLQLLKTDAIVAGIHFLPGTPGQPVGWKAAARVVSDIAAMGGRPDHFLITLAVAADTRLDWLEDVYRGIGACLQVHGATLCGGETTRVPDGSATVISISATGTVERDHLTLRSGGRPADVLFATGTLGGSIHGKHLDFHPRLDAAQWLVRHHKPSAMMDLSDGLARDLPRLAAASQCGFKLDASALPLTGGCSVEQALNDGEDYELLLAIDPARAHALEADWSAVHPDLQLSRIGTLCEAGTGDTLDGGWDHFRRQHAHPPI